jgi:hypothetical protein
MQLRHCEQREAIHSTPCRDMDCFVAVVPRNDGVLSCAGTRFQRLLGWVIGTIL